LFFSPDPGNCIPLSGDFLVIENHDFLNKAGNVADTIRVDFFQVQNSSSPYIPLSDIFFIIVYFQAKKLK